MGPRAIAYAWFYVPTELGNDTEKGQFRSDFFLPVDILVIPHIPFIECNILILSGIYDEVCVIIKKKLDSGVYEPSNSSYRLHSFCILKKDRTSPQIVHSLGPLNHTTIKHSGVPLIPEHLAEQFTGCSCGVMLDLYVGYDEQLIAKLSCNYTTFQMPYGALGLVTLSMGWMNSVPIFHDNVTYILQPEIPCLTILYINDVPVKGPKSYYIQEDGSFKTIPQNPGIQRFVWEHFINLNCIMQCMKYCGETFSGKKLLLCIPKFWVIGHCCTYEGWVTDESQIASIKNWGPCYSLSEVQAFLGTIEVLQIFIHNFAHYAHELVKLTHKGVPFEFGELQVTAQEDLKDALIHSPALWAIDYTFDSLVILTVDTSHIAVSFFLCQCNPTNPKVQHYSYFRSITLNNREAWFSQPKLEIHGLFRALCSLQLYLLRVHNLVMEVDAHYIKEMLVNPDIQPSASINHWILLILTFHFTLVHVKGTLHGPDGLSW